MLLVTTILLAPMDKPLNTENAVLMCAPLLRWLSRLACVVHPTLACAGS